MNVYEISKHPGGNSYDVHVIGAQGTRQTMLGFRTKEEAEAWIVTDKERDRLTASSGWQLPIASPDPNLHTLKSSLIILPSWNLSSPAM